ncbi:hypothetical protein MXB_1077 [Myxobolus squamalis]|nr:hypothetical protein MXB_1077 [Myxobolus squamalis]
MAVESKGANLPPDILIGEKYKIIKLIGKGSFGEVFLGEDVTTKCRVAIKIEVCAHGFSQLTFESKVYRYLSDGVNVPAARLYDIDQSRRALVMELLGSSLEDLHRKWGRRFTLKTICLLADQMLTLLEYLHLRDVIHRDIKPDNFLMGLHDPSRVYIVDFGLAKQYCISRVIPHVKYNNKKCMIGTARYASINAHIGIEQSRRDDLESLGYVLLYLYLGQLPWQGINVENKNRKYDRIMERKLNVSTEILCRHAPQQFRDYLTYVKHLRFDQRPDYMYLRGLFRQILSINNFRFDNIYDWSLSINQRNIQPKIEPINIIKPRISPNYCIKPNIPPVRINLTPTQPNFPVNHIPIIKITPAMVSNVRASPQKNIQTTNHPPVIPTNRKASENKKKSSAQLMQPTNRFEARTRSSSNTFDPVVVASNDNLPNQRYNLRSNKKSDPRNDSFSKSRESAPRTNVT